MSGIFSQESYKSLCQNADIGIIAFDLSSLQILELNARAAEFLSTKPDLPLPILSEKLSDAVNAAIAEWLASPPQSTFNRRKIPLSGVISYIVDLSILRVSHENGEYGLAIIHDVSEQIKIEEILRKDEKKLTNIVNTAPVGIGVAVNRTIKEANRKFCEITGYSRQELISQDFRIFYPSDEDYENIGKILYNHNKITSDAVEVRWRHKDGHPIDVMLYLSPIEPDNLDQGFTYIVLDITERKQIEQALRQSEIKLKSIVDAAPTGIGILRDRVMLEVNQRLCDILGYTREEIIGRNTRVFYRSQKEYEDAGEYMYGTIARGCIATTEFPWFRKDGSQIDVLVNITPIDPTTPSSEIIFTVLDITDRKKAEQALSQSENKLKGIITSVPAGIGILEKRVIVDVNQCLCDILGYGKDELIGQNTQIFYQAQDEYEWAGKYMYDQIRSGNEIATSEFHWKNKNGDPIDVLVNLTPIDPGNPTGPVIFATLDITDRKKAERALQESENKLRSIVSSAPTGIGVVEKRIILEINQRLCDILGYTREEIIGNSSRMFYFSQDEFDAAGMLMYPKIVNGGIATDELVWRHKDGRPIDILLSLTSLDPAAPTGPSMFTIMDITDRKKAERALQESENKLRSIVSSAPTGIGVVEKRIILEINQRLCDILGYTRDEIIGHNSRMFYFSQEDFDVVGKQMYPKIFAEGGIVSNEIVWRHKDGRPIDILLCLTPLDPAEPSGASMFTVMDITDRKKAEQALLASEENLRITLDSIGDAVIATDRNGIITRMNPVAANLTGWSVNAAMGHNMEEVFHIINGETKARVENPVNSIINTGRVIGLPVHTLLVATNSKEYHIADSGAPIRNIQGEIIGAVLVFRDITLQYELEENLRQSQKMESIGKLAGGVAHDFNNMLSGILASAELLGRRIEQGNNKSQELVGIIIKSCQKASDLTQKLLAFARKAKLNVQPLNIHTAIDDALALLERSIDRRIIIARHFDAAKPNILGDASQLLNMFLNLGVNARDAQPEGGVIMVETRNKTLDADQCVAIAPRLKPGNYVHVRFSDTGCGIAPEIIDRIFEPFFTTKEVGKGSGLGLAAVYGTIQEHNGAINVESVPGQGTSFDIYLPGVDAENHIAEAEGKILRGHGGILIIDDEEFIRITAREILEEAGYRVILACDGIDGVEKYRQYHKDIDLVILDMIMPRMNGKECFVELHRINPDVKVIISTGFTSDSNRDYPKDAAGFLRKPFSIGELCGEVHCLLG